MFFYARVRATFFPCMQPKKNNCTSKGGENFSFHSIKIAKWPGARPAPKFCFNKFSDRKRDYKCRLSTKRVCLASKGDIGKTKIVSVTARMFFVGGRQGFENGWVSSAPPPMFPDVCLLPLSSAKKVPKIYTIKSKFVN